MKKILLSFLSLIVGVSAFAQINISADTAFYSYFPKDSMDHHEKITISNPSTTSPVTVTWIKHTENLLSGWQIGGICDKVACYDNPSGAKTFTLNAGQSAIFYVGMIVDQEAASGCSSATIKFTNSGNAETKYGSFKYCAWPLSTRNFENNNIVSIYPNPASNFVNITLNDKNISIINVVNVIGRKIARFDVDYSKSNSLRVPLDNVSDGIYMLQFADENGKILGVKRVTKN